VQILSSDDRLIECSWLVQCFAIELDGGNVGYSYGNRGRFTHHVSNLINGRGLRKC